MCMHYAKSKQINQAWVQSKLQYREQKMCLRMSCPLPYTLPPQVHLQSLTNINKVQVRMG